MTDSTTDRPTRFDGERAQTATLAPENANSEQSEAGTQAQDVAEDAIVRATSVLGSEDSEKVAGGFDDADAQDLVDHIKQMETSGVIDMSAFRGEPGMDDEDDAYGKAAPPEE